MATAQNNVGAASVTDRRGDVRRVLMVALGLNITMSLLKLVVGLISGSLAVIADAMHSATDALSSLTGLITNSRIGIIPTATTNTRPSVPWESPDSSCSQRWRSCCAPVSG